jgi:hypothetical protein
MPFSCGFVRIETDLGKIIHYVQIQRILCFIAKNKLENLARVCIETLLTGEPGSIVRVGASLGRELLPPPPQAGGKRFTHWTSETAYWSEAAGSPQGSTPAI